MKFILQTSRLINAQRFLPNFDSLQFDFCEFIIDKLPSLGLCEPNKSKINSFKSFLNQSFTGVENPFYLFDYIFQLQKWFHNFFK